MSCFTEEQLNKISNLVKEIEKLSDIEKLMLYLQLPCNRTEQSEGKYNRLGGKQNADIFSKKPDQETTQIYTWILSHLEEDPNVSLPKQEVYDEYRAFCQANRFEPLCVADFGKAMKHAFPCIKPRRLGQRGNSRYCYSGLRKKYKIQPPSLPDISEMLEPSVSSNNNNNTNNNDNNNGNFFNDNNCSPPIQQQEQQQQHLQNFNHNNNDHNFIQSPSTSVRPNVIKPSVTTNNGCSSLNSNNGIHHQLNDQHTPTHHHHHHHQQQQQHQQQQHHHNIHQQQSEHYEAQHQRQSAAYSAGYEAMNLKIEPNHEHNHRSQATILTNHSADNGDYVDSLHHIANGHKINHNANSNNNDNNNNSNNDGSGGEMSTMAPASQMSSTASNGASQPPSVIEAAQPMTTANCNDYGGQSNSGHGLIVTRPQDYDYNGSIIQRFGTPDDDDYRHHYHDLNRPIVSEVIPFSQTGQYHPSVGFIYGHNHTTTQPTHPIPPSQHHQHLTTNNINDNNNLNNDSIPSTGVNNQHATTNGRGQIDDHPDPNHHQYQHQHQHQHQQTSVNSSEHEINQPLHNLQLNTNNNHLNNQSVDCCASPFQSPASTPYPIISNLMMQDVQDYYPGECIRYQHH